MKQKSDKISHPLLDRPRILLREPSAPAKFLFYAVLVILGGWGALGCFFTAFEVPLSSGQILTVGGFYALLCTFLLLAQQLPRRLWPLHLATAAAWLLTVWIYFDELLQGCLRTLNLVLASYGEKLNMHFYLFPTEPAGPRAATLQCTVFAGILLLPFFWLLSWLLIQRRSALGCFLLTGLFLLCPMALSILPDAWSLAMLLLFWIMLLFLAPSLGQRHKLLDERGAFRASGVTAARPATLLLLPAAALCMALVYAAFPQETYKRPEIVNDIRTGLTQGFGLGGVFSGGTGNGNSSVNLRSLGERKFTGKTVLRVKHEWNKEIAGAQVSVDNKQKDYLKSFVGSVYTGDGWQTMPREELAELEALLPDYAAQNLPARFSELLPSDIITPDTGVSYTLSVENVGGNPRCVYTPYGLSSVPQDLSLQKIELAEDGFLKSSNWLTGTKEYQLRAVGMPALESYFSYFYPLRCESHLQQVLALQTAQDYYDSILSGEEESFASGGIAGSGGFTFTFGSDENGSSPESFTDFTPLWQEKMRQLRESVPEKNFDLWTAPDWALEPLSEDARKFAREVEDYTAFVYEHYTALPDGLKETLEAYCRDQGIPLPGDMEAPWETSVIAFFLGAMRELFSQQFTYTLSPPSVPRERDFVEYFLTESRKGYCVHFATAAVALCRAAGIPARYAEGYAVPVGKDGQWVTVPDRNAHAWLEIYQGGIGWVPVEVTPPSPDAPAVYEDARAPKATPTPLPSSSQASSALESSQGASLSSAAPSSSSPTASQASSQTGPAEAEPEEPALWPMFAAIPAVLLLLCLTLWGSRRIHLGARKKEFSQENRSKAALCVYAHLVRLWEQASALPGASKEPPEEWERLALKARFSQHTLTPEELAVLTEAAAALEEKLRKELPLPSRLRCQYLLGLF